MSFIDQAKAVGGKAVFLNNYTNAKDVTGSSSAGQKDVIMADTGGFTANDRVFLGRGTDREEEIVIDSVTSNTKITAKDNLTYNHTVDADTVVTAEKEDIPENNATEFLAGGTWTSKDWTEDSGAYTHDVATVEEVLLADGGSGYEANDVLKLKQGDNDTCEIKVLTVDDEGKILTFEIHDKGYGYEVGVELETEEGNGTGAVFSITAVYNITPLSYSKPAVINRRYQIGVTITGWTEGTIKVEFGGNSAVMYSTQSRKWFTADTGNLVITPTITFDGKVSVSIKEITNILPATLTADFLPGEKILVGSDTEYVIYSVQTNTSLTLTENLKRTHEKDETIVQKGIGAVVEKAWCDTSTVIDKRFYDDICFFVPKDWTTAKVTFLGCDTYNGDYVPIKALNDYVDDKGDLQIGDIELITPDAVDTSGGEVSLIWTGLFKEALKAIPYLRLLSGVVGSEVDQGSGKVAVRYVMRR